MNFPVRQQCSEYAYALPTRILVLALAPAWICLFFQSVGLAIVGAVALPITVFCTYSRTEFDSQQIAKVFRIGRFWQIKYTVVNWNDVSKVSAYKDRGLANLRIVMRDGARKNFTVPEKSVAGDSFYEIGSYFERNTSQLTK
ncbi:MAG: hypothetical protein JWO95_637 [Verrucomicrobiales bacterium]|nr:hypothetical protein [Verrucomicrobiales bacterium]